MGTCVWSGDERLAIILLRVIRNLTDKKTFEQIHKENKRGGCATVQGKCVQP